MLLTDRKQLFDTLLLSQAPDTASQNAGGIRTVTDTTLKWFQNATNQLIKHIGNQRIDHITPQILYEFQTAVSKRATNQTANNYLRAIRTIYNRLIQHNLIASNPATYVPNLPEPTGQPRAMSYETYEAMRLVANTRDRAIIDLLYISGCRIGELQTIEMNSIETETNQIQMAMQVLGKGKKYRHIYATGLQAQSVIKYINERPLTKHKQLFISRRGTPLAYGSYFSVLKKMREDAQIPDTVISNAHGLRHHAALRWLENGVDLATVSQWLGHSNPEFTARVYCIQTEAQLRKKFYNR